MNSKLLIKQNRELFDKLQISNLNCRRLTEENIALKQKIQFLTEQLSARSEPLAEPTVDISTDETTLETKEETVELVEEIELEPEIEYGSKIIGEIVMSATYHSSLMGSANKENLKELLNLILGRCEVAKSEILNIASSETTIDNKMKMIDTERDEAIEYFKSILGQ